MTIIIEGSDCCGKTRVAKYIAANSHLDYVWQDKPPEGYNYLSNGISELGDNQVRDRFFLSEIVYGRMLGLGQRFTTYAEMTHLRNYLRWMRVDILVFFWENDADYRAFLITQVHAEATPTQAFSVDQMVQANTCYRGLAKQLMWCDRSYAISTKHGVPQWPHTSLLDAWAEEVR